MQSQIPRSPKQVAFADEVGKSLGHHSNNPYRPPQKRVAAIPTSPPMSLSEPAKSSSSVVSYSQRAVTNPSPSWKHGRSEKGPHSTVSRDVFNQGSTDTVISNTKGVQNEEETGVLSHSHASPTSSTLTFGPTSLQGGAASSPGQSMSAQGRDSVHINPTTTSPQTASVRATYGLVSSPTTHNSSTVTNSDGHRHQDSYASENNTVATQSLGEGSIRSLFADRSPQKVISKHVSPSYSGVYLGLVAFACFLIMVVVRPPFLVYNGRLSILRMGVLLCVLTSFLAAFPYVCQYAWPSLRHAGKKTQGIQQSSRGSHHRII
jgi:hypothetical protein